MSEVNKKPRDPNTEANGMKNRTLLAENDALRKENAKLKDQLGLGFAPKVIEKKFTHDEAEYQFAPGHTQVRIGQTIYDTEGLLALAAGEDPDEVSLTASPELADINKDGATKILTDLIEIGYGYFQKVEKQDK